MKKILYAIIICMLVTGCTSLKTSDENKSDNTSEVEYRTLVVYENKEKYTYEDMQKDLDTLSLAYKDRAKLNVLGKTIDGRSIYEMLIGNENAKQHVIIHASIHAREYITTKLVIRQMAQYLYELKNNTGVYKSKSYNELFEDVALHIVPMVNPDGVTISQSGLEKINKPQTKELVASIAAMDGKQITQEYLTQWKANANGVDLNRNYDALWDQYQGPTHQSGDHYKGKEPFSENETKALVDLTKNNNVVRTISYHTYGQVIYWYFGQTGDLYDKSMNFAQCISEATGYPMDDNYQNLDPAGYKDWAIDKLSIPSITIEVGYGKNPLPNEQFEQIWQENKDVWAAVLYDIKDKGGQ